jgi:hypothetical protein
MGMMGLIMLGAAEVEAGGCCTGGGHWRGRGEERACPGCVVCCHSLTEVLCSRLIIRLVRLVGVKKHSAGV